MRSRRVRASCAQSAKTECSGRRVKRCAKVQVRRRDRSSTPSAGGTSLAAAWAELPSALHQGLQLLWQWLLRCLQLNVHQRITLVLPHTRLASRLQAVHAAHIMGNLGIDAQLELASSMTLQQATLACPSLPESEGARFRTLVSGDMQRGASAPRWLFERRRPHHPGEVWQPAEHMQQGSGCMHVVDCTKWTACKLQTRQRAHWRGRRRSSCSPGPTSMQRSTCRHRIAWQHCATLAALPNPCLLCRTIAAICTMVRWAFGFGLCKACTSGAACLPLLPYAPVF